MSCVSPEVHVEGVHWTQRLHNLMPTHSSGIVQNVFQIIQVVIYDVQQFTHKNQHSAHDEYMGHH